MSVTLCRCSHLPLNGLNAFKVKPRLSLERISSKSPNTRPGSTARSVKLSLRSRLLSLSERPSITQIWFQLLLHPKITPGHGAKCKPQLNAQILTLTCHVNCSVKTFISKWDHEFLSLTKDFFVGGGHCADMDSRQVDMGQGPAVGTARHPLPPVCGAPRHPSPQRLHLRPAGRNAPAQNCHQRHAHLRDQHGTVRCACMPCRRPHPRPRRLDAPRSRFHRRATHWRCLGSCHAPWLFTHRLINKTPSHCKESYIVVTDQAWPKAKSLTGLLSLFRWGIICFCFTKINRVR